MGKDCLAGWTELQDYRAAKANLWLWAADLKRLLVFWEWRGSTDKSGANFWLCLGDTSNDHPQKAQTHCYPITAPSKKDGSFKFKNLKHADLIKWELDNIEPDETKHLEAQREWAPLAITRYEAVGAPLGSKAWL